MSTRAGKFLQIFLIFLTFSSLSSINAEEQAFGLQEKPGEFLPSDIFVLNEDSAEVQLSDLITKPTLISFVYYHCPALCPKMLEGISELVNFSDALPGMDYQVITLSIDHNEPAELARQIKSDSYAGITKNIDPYFWRFFTADSVNVAKLTEAVGWEFRKQGDNFVHTTSSVLITPKGMVSQYFYGTYFNYMHFSLSVEKSKQELIVPTRLKTLKYCYNYQPAENTKVQVITKAYGILVIILVLSLFVSLAFRKAKVSGHARKEGNE